MRIRNIALTIIVVSSFALASLANENNQNLIADHGGYCCEDEGAICVIGPVVTYDAYAATFEGGCPFDETVRIVPLLHLAE